MRKKQKFKYIVGVSIELLIPHEKTMNKHVNYWNNMYLSKSFIPAVAVSEENIIIDGHHRIEMCKQNGVKEVNLCEFDYFDPTIIVKGNYMSKDKVFNSAITGSLLDPQTSTHYIDIDGEFRKIIDIQKKYSLV
ncbi:MAG: hypothetical protein P8J35_09410 [Candidatus Marinimicrobia bacterium]|nr:hypothetical protein [Candidatus Neomarinimicrobiota bacterium]|tara:strand:- start:674 stop:1075 length:402 start_codon:yes stop_codon:yes gene_type:complete